MMCSWTLTLELVLCSAVQRVRERADLHLDLLVLLEDVEDDLVRHAHQLDEVREVAVPSVLVYPEKPYEAVNVHLGRCRLVGDVSRVDRVASVGVARVVEVDHMGLRHDRVLVRVQQELVVEYLREVRELVVIDEHRVSLADHLLDEGAVHGERLSGSRGSEDHGRAERVHHVDPSVMDGSLVMVSGRDVAGVLGLDLLVALLERLIVPP